MGVSPVPVGRCRDIKAKVKVTFTLEQATRVQRGSRYAVLLFL
jgi:hypothetical protein